VGYSTSGGSGTQQGASDTNGVGNSADPIPGSCPRGATPTFEQHQVTGDRHRNFSHNRRCVSSRFDGVSTDDLLGSCQRVDVDVTGAAHGRRTPAMNSRLFFLLTCCLCVVALAMSFYVWQLRNRAVDNSTPSVTPEVIAAPSNATQKQITLWVAHDDTATLKSQSVSIASSPERQRQAEDILRALLEIYVSKGSPHPLPAGAAVRNVYFVESGLVLIDVNSNFASGQTSGILAEELTLSSLVQTLASNIQGISRVKFLVEGKEASTLAGHADLSSIYDLAQYANFARQLTSP
jgi:hypothetical protein